MVKLTIFLTFEVAKSFFFLTCHLKTAILLLFSSTQVDKNIYTIEEHEELEMRLDNESGDDNEDVHSADEVESA